MCKTALLIIDVQKGFDEPIWGKRNNPEAESNIALLLSKWRTEGLPVVHVRHASMEKDSPLRPELPGHEFKDEAEPLPGEKQFLKSVNSAFIGTKLEEHLREQGIFSLVLVGLTTDHCVSTSVRMAANLGFNVTVPCDATATFDRVAYDGALCVAEDIHRISLASLSGEFCSVRSTEEILQEMA